MTGSGFAEYGLEAVEALRVSGKYKGLTFLFALRRGLAVRLEEERYELPEGSVLLVNPDEHYEAQGEAGNILIRLEISNQYFARYYKDSFYYRYRLLPTDQADVKAVYMNNIKRLLARLTMAEVGGNSEYSLLEINRLLSELLLILVSAFREAAPETRRRFRGYSQRIEHILNFLQENYQRNISLQDLAAREFVSFAYLSRLFKKEVGLNFVEYLTKLRFDNAVHALLNSTKGIAEAAEESGFASSRQFAKLFKAAYRKTPSEFLRERGRAKDGPASAPPGAAIQTTEAQADKSRAVDARLLVNLLSDVIRANDGEESFTHYSPLVEQRVELNAKPGPPLPRLCYYLLIKDLRELLKSQVRAQIIDLSKVAFIGGVEALFPQNPAAPEPGTDEPVPTYSPYLALEQGVAFLHEQKIGLHLHFVHQPESQQEHYFGEISKTLQNFINIFGPGYVGAWRFIYYSRDGESGGAGEGGSPEFAQGYAAFRALLRGLLPEARVGVFFPFPRGEVEEIEAFCRSELPKSMDFLCYSAGFHEWGDLAERLESDFVETAASYVRDKTLRLSSCLKRHGLNIPLFLTKWNTLTGLTRHTNGSFFRGALIFKTLLAVAPRVQGVGISLNTEILKETRDEYIEVSGITPYYIGLTRRPLFFVLQFLEKLLGSVVSRSEEHIITRTADGYRLLFMNPTVFRPSLSIQEHVTQNFKKKKIITVCGLEPGSYQVRRHVLDQQDGALYRQFMRFGSKYGLDSEAFEYLERLTVPSLTICDEEIASGEWSILEDFDINAIHLFELRRMRAGKGQF